MEQWPYLMCADSAGPTHIDDQCQDWNFCMQKTHAFNVPIPGHPGNFNTKPQA